MGSVIVLLGIIGLLVLFCYLKFPPPYAKRKLVNAFDIMVLVVCAFICLMWIFKMHASLVDTSDEDWELPLAVGGALGIEIVFLGICFLMRNFWVFKPPRRPGKDGFFGF